MTAGGKGRLRPFTVSRAAASEIAKCPPPRLILESNGKFRWGLSEFHALPITAGVTSVIMGVTFYHPVPIYSTVPSSYLLDPPPTQRVISPHRMSLSPLEGFFVKVYLPLTPFWCYPSPLDVFPSFNTCVLLRPLPSKPSSTPG